MHDYVWVCACARVFGVLFERWWTIISRFIRALRDITKSWRTVVYRTLMISRVSVTPWVFTDFVNTLRYAETFYGLDKTILRQNFGRGLIKCPLVSKCPFTDPSVTASDTTMYLHDRNRTAGWITIDGALLFNHIVSRLRTAPWYRSRPTERNIWTLLVS